MFVQIQVPDRNVVRAVRSGWGYTSYWMLGADLLPAPADTIQELFPRMAHSYRVVLRWSYGGATEYRLTRRRLTRGVEAMAQHVPTLFGHLLEDLGLRVDAALGDVLLQCALFGEVVYQ